MAFAARVLLALWLAVGGWLVPLHLAQAAGATGGVQPVPPLRAHVVDETGTLEPSQLQALETKLTNFEKTKGSQVAMLIVATTQPEDIASYANRVGNAWKIGRKAVGDGLLVVVAKNDRKVRIEVAKSLEGAIPDLAAKAVIDEAITPAFKRGDFAGGLDAAADRLIALITGEKLPEPEQQGDSSQGSIDDGFQWMDMAIFLFFAVPIAGSVLRGIFGRKLAALFTGGAVGVIAWFVTASFIVAGIGAVAALLFTLLTSFGSLGNLARSSGRSGGWSSGGSGGWSSGSSSSSSDSFSSGGGGDFGGGGASGDW